MSELLITIMIDNYNYNNNSLKEHTLGRSSVLKRTKIIKNPKKDVFRRPSFYKRLMIVKQSIKNIFKILGLLRLFWRWPTGLHHLFHHVELDAAFGLVFADGDVVEHVEVPHVQQL